MNEIQELLECDEKSIPYYTLEGQQYICKCVRVYDGDTITVIFKPKVLNKLYKYNVRLDGIDAPEIKSINIIEKELAIQARDFLREKILGKLIKINCGKYDKYGRMLATVFELHNGRSLNDILVEQNYACRYDGGKKKLWPNTQDMVLDKLITEVSATDEPIAQNLMPPLNSLHLRG